MDTLASTVLKRGPGRPRAQGKGQAMARLVEATEALLRESSHHELSERKIAAAAGSNEAMIHYYFGGKDGLLFEVMLRYYDEVIEKLGALESVDPASPTATRDIFAIMTRAYYEKHWIARMVVAEFARGNSAFKNLYLERFGPQGIGLARLRRAIDRMIQSGAYVRDTNPDYMAQSMFCMIIGPFLLAPFSCGSGLNPGFPHQEEWIDYVADLFERKLRVKP